MSLREKRLTVKGLVTFASLMVFFSILHVADDTLREPDGLAVVSGQVLGTNEQFAVLSVLLWTITIFGIGWTWKERKYGYAILLVLSFFPGFFANFLSHVIGLTDSLTEIGNFYADRGLSALFVFSSLAAGVTSLTTLLLAIYILAVPKKT